MRQINFRIFLLLFLFSIITSNAQSQTITLNGGPNYDFVFVKVGGIDYTEGYEGKFGFRLGSNISFDLNEKLAIETGLDFKLSRLSHLKLPSREEPDRLESKSYYGYLDFPLLLKQSFNLKKTNLFLEVGGYGSFGIFGKLKYTRYSHDEFLYNHVIRTEWGNSVHDDFKRLDLGLCFGIGTEYGKLIYSILYEHGLRDVITFDGISRKNRGITFNIGYRLWN